MAEAKEKEVKKVAEVKKAQPKIAKPKFVTVKSKINGKRFIGGRWYEMKKDKEIEVTEDAKRSLLEAGAIYL